MSAYLFLSPNKKCDRRQLAIKNLILYNKKVSSFHIYEHTPFHKREGMKNAPHFY